MRLIISTILIVATTLLNLIFILLTKKYKDFKLITELGHKAKGECISLLSRLWKKQIILVALGITLCFLSIFIDVDNRIVLYTFEILGALYSLIGISSGIFNYTKFNKNIGILLNKTSK